MLPLIVFAVGLAYSNYRQDRSEATRRVLETVRSMRLVLDSEVQRMTGGLQVLALGDSCKAAISTASAGWRSNSRASMAETASCCWPTDPAGSCFRP